MKTRAAIELDKLGVPYELKEFEPQEIGTQEVVEMLGVPHEQVVKTLVTNGDATGVMLALVPGPKSLDLKALARASGNKRCAMVAKVDVEKLTGYVCGGCTALGAKKKFPVFMDSGCMGLPYISVSAGKRGAQIFVKPEDWARVTGAEIADIAK
ncbi:MAG: aminoacyl-tRNA deacylase [Planctomycetota bacterium]